MPWNKSLYMYNTYKKIGMLKTNQWLKSAGQKVETEGLIIAAQKQNLSTRNYQASIVKNGSNPIYRLWKQTTESIDHLVFGSPILIPIEFKERHDKIGHYIH